MVANSNSVDELRFSVARYIGVSVEHVALLLKQREGNNYIVHQFIDLRIQNLEIFHSRMEIVCCGITDSKME